MKTFEPATEPEAAAIVAEACAQKRPLSIEGNGSKRGLGRLIETPAVLKMSGLRGIVAYEPEELVITVRAGTPLAEVERVLAEKNQCLAFEPGTWSLDGGEATIGGTVAAGVAGSRRVVIGGARDHLIGFRAINGEGQIFKAGGRVVKNVTGYDLPKLAAGSFGTLFALTELTLRTYPRTKMPLTLFVPDLDLESGCALLRRAVSSPFEATGFCFFPRAAIKRMNLWRSFDADEASLTLIRFEGGVASIGTRSHALGRAIAPPDASTVAGLSAQECPWVQLLQLRPFWHSGQLWRISVPPSAAATVVAALRPDCFVVDWAGGLVWAELGPAPTTEVHNVAAESGGHAMLFHGDDDERRTMPVFQPLDRATMALTKRLKAAFDPAGVLNPGRMYDGI